MGQGRRDYTWGYLNESASGSRYTIGYMEYFVEEYTGGHGGTVYSYKVPEGYRLGVNRIHLTTNSHAINPVTIEVEGILKAGYFLNEAYSFEISDQSPFYVEEAETLTVTAVNNDEVEATFVGAVVGVLEQLIA